jgi:hypothetical protein
MLNTVSSNHLHGKHRSLVKVDMFWTQFSSSSDEKVGLRHCGGIGTGCPQ